MNLPSHSPGRNTAEQCADCVIARGCEGCFEELVRRFQSSLLHFLMRRVGSRHDAEDLLQETFLVAYRKIGSFKSSWRFSTWLFTIAFRLSVSSQRKRREPQGDLRMSTEEAGPLSSIENAEMRSGLWDAARDCLEPEAFSGLWLRYVESMPADQIGLVLGRNANAVRILLHRARTQLGEALNRRGLSPEWCHESE